MVLLFKAGAFNIMVVDGILVVGTGMDNLFWRDTKEEDYGKP